MAQRELKIKVLADAKALDKLSKSARDFGDKMKKASAVAAVGFAALTAASVKTVKAFQAQEKAEAKLAQIAKTASGATDKQIQSLKDLASAQQKVGVIGDEVTIAGQAQLATFGLSTDAIAKLTGGMLDLAANTKGAEATQEDLMNTANLIGKVMDGQVGALTRVGVSLTDQQAELIKTGNEMERASVVAEVLNQNVGGVNEALRNTSAGGMAALRNSFGDLQEKIGEIIANAITPLVQNLTPLIDKIAEWIKENSDLVGKILAVTAGVLAFIAILAPLGFAIAGITTAATALGAVLAFIAANPIILIIAAIVLLITWLIKWMGGWDQVKLKVSSTWETIKLVITTGINLIQTALQSFIDKIKTGFSTFWETIKTGWTNFWEGLKNIVFNIIEAIKNKIQDMFGRITAIIDKLKELKEKAKGALSFGGGGDDGGGGGRRRATGGGIGAGQTTMVGENGPEAVTFSRAANITPNHRLGGGTTIVNVNVTGNTLLGEDDAIGVTIGDKIISHFRLNNKFG